MKVISNIAKYRTFILLIGMMAGLSIIAQPLASAYVTSKIADRTEKNVESDQQSTENPSEAQISTLEAVTPTAQLQLSPLTLILEDELIEESLESKTWAKLVVHLPEKLLKVLFNILIAPNAP